jgi:hypothetical protein
LRYCVIGDIGLRWAWDVQGCLDCNFQGIRERKRRHAIVASFDSCRLSRRLLFSDPLFSHAKTSYIVCKRPAIEAFLQPHSQQPTLSRCLSTTCAIYIDDCADADKRQVTLKENANADELSKAKEKAKADGGEIKHEFTLIKGFTSVFSS